jgi:hypothetical protein
MRRLFLGSLLSAALATGGSAFAIEAGSAPGAVSAAPPGKQAAHPKPKKRPTPLSAEAAREAARATELSAASIHSGQSRSAPRSSTQPSWTGTYVGVGVAGGFDAGVGK